MIPKRPSIALVLVAVLLAPVGPGALAQSAADNAKEADALFKEGRRLYDDHKLDLACKKLAESQRLRSSINTVGLLAACHEEQGKLATALRDYQKTEELARAAKDPRAEFAHQRAEALRPKVPLLTIRMQTAVDGLVVTKNGRAVPESAIGAEAQLDPGQIELEATAPGRKPWQKSITIEVGSKNEIVVPELERIQNDAPPPPVPSSSTSSEGMRAPRVAGLIIGAVGVAGIGVGSGLGVAAIGKKKESDRLGCNAKSECTEAAAKVRNESRSLALGSTIGFAVGLAGVGAGLTLFIVGGSKQSPLSSSPSAALPVRLAPLVATTSSGAPFVSGALVSGDF